MEKRDTEYSLKKIYSKVNADNHDDLVFRNHALLELGSLYFEKCDYPNAVDCLEKVKTEALQFQLYTNYFRSISILQRIHTERLDFERHETLMKEVLQVSSSLSTYKRFKPKFLYNQAIAAMYKRDLINAQRSFEEAERVAAEVLSEDLTLERKDRDDLRRDRLLARYGLAVICKDEKRYRETLLITEKLHKDIADFSEGEEASEHFNLYDLDASVRILEGHCYRDLGQFPQALDKYWEAHGILKSQRNWSHYYYVLLGLGRVYLAMENPERAQIFFDLISDAVNGLELNALKRSLEKVVSQAPGSQGSNKLLIDRERKVIIEKTLGEVQFERRFVLLEILYLLASQPGKIFSKEELVDRIWRESYNPMIHDSKVYTSISRLRKLIEPDFKRPLYIMNERDGYAFNPGIQVEDVSQRGHKTSVAQVEMPLRKEKSIELREGMNL